MCPGVYHKMSSQRDFVILPRHFYKKRNHLFPGFRYRYLYNFVNRKQQVLSKFL